MIFSTSFFNRYCALLLFGALSLAGCSLSRTDKLRLVSVAADPASPQAAYAGPVIWQAEAAGGTPPLQYEFRLTNTQDSALVQSSPDPRWAWTARSTGQYQVSITVSDAAGNKVISDPFPYRITAPINEETVIALLPIENLSSTRAPLNDISARYREILKNAGFRLLDTHRLEAFMQRHRIRYTGGIDTELARTIQEEEQVDAVIISSLETYSESPPLRVALTSRLVLCTETPVIAWIDGIGLSGVDSPGLLGLGRIDSMPRLLDKTLVGLLSSLQRTLKGQTQSRPKAAAKHQPRSYYRSPDLDPNQTYRVAIVPFLNRYARRYAGDILPLHLIRALHEAPNLEVIEPGVVREQLLKYRLIMQAGPSLAIADVLSSPNVLGADIILSGHVYDYQDKTGTPKIDFSTRLFSGDEHTLSWWSEHYATGSDNVYFYDFGRYQSTHVMLQEMAQTIRELLFPRQTAHETFNASNGNNHKDEIDNP